MNRKTHRLNLVCIALLTLPASIATAQDKPTGTPALDPGVAQFDSAAPAALIVKRAPTGHLLVQPRINGADAGWFIFDSGAGVCVISTPHMQRFQLVDAGPIAAVGSGGGENARLYRADTLTIGPLTLRGHPLMATDLTFLREHLKEDIAGVLGYGVLARCIAEIDLDSPRIALHDPAKYTAADLAWAPLDLSGRVPVVTGRFEGHEGSFLLDSGGNSGVTFYVPAVQRLRLLDGRTVTDAKVGGVGGFAATKRGTIAWFELAGKRLTDVPAEFAVEARGSLADSQREGRIGIDVLRRFVIVLDYSGARLALRAKA